MSLERAVSSPGEEEEKGDKEKEGEQEEENFLIADCSGCGEAGEYWLRVYRDQNYFRLHLIFPPGASTSPSGKFCGNYSKNVRWAKPQADGSTTAAVSGPVGMGIKAAVAIKSPPEPRVELKRKRNPITEVKSIIKDPSPPASKSSSEEEDCSGESSSSDDDAPTFPCESCGREFMTEIRLSDHRRRSANCMQEEDRRTKRRNSRELREAALQDGNNSLSSSNQVDSLSTVDNVESATSLDKHNVADERIVSAVEVNGLNSKPDTTSVKTVPKPEEKKDIEYSSCPPKSIFPDTEHAQPQNDPPPHVDPIHSPARRVKNSPSSHSHLTYTSTVDHDNDIRKGRDSYRHHRDQSGDFDHGRYWGDESGGNQYRDRDRHWHRDSSVRNQKYASSSPSLPAHEQHNQHSGSGRSKHESYDRSGDHHRSNSRWNHRYDTEYNSSCRAQEGSNSSQSPASPTHKNLISKRSPVVNHSDDRSGYNSSNRYPRNDNAHNLSANYTYNYPTDSRNNSLDNRQSSEIRNEYGVSSPMSRKSEISSSQNYQERYADRRYRPKSHMSSNDNRTIQNYPPAPSRFHPSSQDLFSTASSFPPGNRNIRKSRFSDR